MIYFIKDTVTQAVKIGYSKNAQKRLAHLQTATPDKLVLLGTLHGGLEHETAFHERFANYKLQGEWFKGDILPEVLAIISKDADNPQQAKINVIVWADSDFNRQVNFMWSSDPKQQACRENGEALVIQTLNELHAKTPIAYVILGSGRGVDSFAWQWAHQNKVQVYGYAPNWRRHGKGAVSKVGARMLRSLFDPKVLLVFHSSEVSKVTTTLLRRAEKAGIPVVKKESRDSR
jgi:hypothetical protein